MDVSVILKDARGEEIDFGTEKLTLELALYQALVAITEKDKNTSGAEKYARHKLTEKIVKDDPEFSIDELKILKDRVGEVWGVAVVGAVWDILEEK